MRCLYLGCAYALLGVLVAFVVCCGLLVLLCLGTWYAGLIRQCIEHGVFSYNKKGQKYSGLLGL